MSVDPHDIRHLVVLGHPAPWSFNGSVAADYCDAVRGCDQTAVLRNLYEIGFDPLLKNEERPDVPGFAPAPDVQEEIDLIRDSAVIVLVYPIWFGMPPAIIKGYVDRVMGAGLAARDIKTGTGLRPLEGKRLVILSSSASTIPWLEEHGQWASMRQAFDTYLTTIFSMAGSAHVHFDAIVDGRDERFVREDLERVREQARATCAMVLSERHKIQTRAIVQGNGA
jgi:NAD(P)H dehydrogenase (quinone)